jgi:hypothetical protein
MMLNSIHYLNYRLGRARALTETTAAERACLRVYATGKLRLAEIGVFHGVNTRSFREVMDPAATLLAIDPFCRSFFGIRGYGWARRIAHREVEGGRRGQVIWVEKRGEDAPLDPAVQPFLPVDFLFVDGDHSYEGLAGDWGAWKGQVREGGVVALHDSRNRNGCGSERYTAEVILRDAGFACVEQVDSLTVLRRCAVDGNRDG